MRDSKTSRILGRVLYLLLLGFLLTLADANGLECKKAVTAVEKTICTDPVLKRLDAELQKNYRAVKNNIVPEGLASLVATQRAWLTDRDRFCATGAKDCVLKKYQERNDILLALLAQTSYENPNIDRANPAILSGSWIVSRMTEPPMPPSYVVASAAHLPPSGVRLTANVGELCVTRQQDDRNCWDFGLVVVPSESNGKLENDKVVAGSITLLTYLGGKADFLLKVRANKELAAVFDACQPPLKNCRQFSQRWIPDSPDADVKVFRIFGD